MEHNSKAFVTEVAETTPARWVLVHDLYEDADRAFRVDKVISYTATFRLGDENMLVRLWLTGQDKPHEIVMTMGIYRRFAAMMGLTVCADCRRPVSDMAAESAHIGYDGMPDVTADRNPDIKQEARG